MKWFLFSSLRARLILLVLLAVIPAIGLTVYSGLEQRSHVRMDAFNSALGIAQKASDDQENLIESTHQLLIALAQMDQVLKCPSSGDSPFLSNLMKEFPFYTNLGTTGPDGQVICSAVPMRQPINFADREWFPRIIRNRKFTLSEYLIGRITGKPSIVLSYPILGGSAHLRGVVFASISLDWLNQIAIKAQLHPDSVITVIDRKGTILARYPDSKKWVGQKMPDAPIMKAILSRQGKGTVEIRGIDGVLRLYAFTPLSKRSEVDAYVSVGIPSKLAFVDVNRSLFRNLVLLGLVSILALATAWFIGNLFIIYPVNRLLDATQQLAQGDLTVRTGTLYGSGEIGQLAHSFDQMAESLEQRNAEGKRMEDALKESEQKYRVLTENLNQLVYRADPETLAAVYVNQAAEIIYGYTVSEWLADPSLWEKLLHPQDKERVIRFFEEARRLRKDSYIEYRIIQRDGAERWVVDRFNWERDAAGHVTALNGIISDISDRKQAEGELKKYREYLEELVESRAAELKQSEERFRIAVESVSDLIWEWDIVKGDLAWFGKIDEMLGYEPGEFPRTLEAWEKIIHPDDHDRVMTILDQHLQTRKPYLGEYRVFKKDGSIIYWFDSGTALWDEEGKAYKMIGAISDITKRKQAQEALALQARIANIFLSVPDDEMYNEVLKVILEVMQSQYGVFGYIDVDGALVVPSMTRHIWDRCQVPDKTFTFPRETWGDSSWPRAIREKKNNYTNEASTRTPVGHINIRRHISFPILFQGEVIGLIQVANKETDYTEADIRSLEAIAGHIAPILSARLQRKRAEEETKKLNEELKLRAKELEAINRELEAFSYSVSHDLRAPLRSIDGFSQVLLEDYSDKLDEEGKRSLQRVRAGSQRMGQLIDDLLKLSRVTRGEMRQELVDLSSMAKAALTEFQKSEPEREVECFVAEGVVTHGDGRLLRVVLENLLGNAWKFTVKRSQGRIEFGTTQGDGQKIYFIRDNGAGFDMSFSDKLFGAFQRLHGTNEFPGTGIGLATVQRIIHRHGGKVWAEGETGKGASFYFTLS